MRQTGQSWNGRALAFARRRANCQPSMLPMHTGAARIGLAVCVLVHVVFVSWSPARRLWRRSCRCGVLDGAVARRSFVCACSGSGCSGACIVEARASEGRAALRAVWYAVER
eukprot:7233882-Prymnesium_polylepis.1